MNKKLHYKMYKAGKRWLFGTIMTASMGISIVAMNNVVQADTNVSDIQTSGEVIKNDSSAINEKLATSQSNSSELATTQSTDSNKVSDSSEVATSQAADNNKVSDSSEVATSQAADNNKVSDSSEVATSQAADNSKVSDSSEVATSQAADNNKVSDSSEVATSQVADNNKVSDSSEAATSQAADNNKVSDSSEAATSQSTGNNDSIAATSQVDESADATEINQTQASSMVANQNNPKNNTQKHEQQVQKNEIKKQRTTQNSVVSVSYQTFLKRVGVRANEITHVTQANFLDYFDLDGDATYDPATGVVTLVPDENDKVGNFTLKNKIDLNQSFQLVGQVNLGDDSNGADGIGLAFHNGNTSDIGVSGGSNGMGHLEHAVGFKLDTWHNDAADPNPDATSDSDKFGTSPDPDTNGEPFGSFVTTTYKHPNDNEDFPEVWWPETAQNEGEDGYQVIGNDSVDGQYHDFTMNYDGETHELVVTYDTNDGILTWRKTIDINNYDNNMAAFMMSASTGWAKNLHLFKITSFDYYGSEDALIHFIDGTTGAELETEEINGLPGEPINYDANEKINDYINQGYELQSNELTPDAVYDNDELVDQEFNIILVHGQATINAANPAVPGAPINVNDPNSPVYPPGTDFNSVSHNVSQTINYQFADGTTAAPTATDAVTFNRDVIVDKVTGEILSTGNWQPVNDDTSFDEVSSPVVDGYYANIGKIDTVDGLTENSQDSNQVVVYEPVGQVIMSSPDSDFPNAGTITYPNDPTDPTAVGSVTLPDVPGYTAFDTDGNELAPGMIITPVNPGEDTNIIYQRDTGTVTVNYVDQDNNVLNDQVVINGNTGDTYETNSPVIDGYYLTAQPGNATGVIDKAGTTVTYTYAPVGSLVATSDDPDFPGVDAVPYPNDSSDPTKVGTVTIPEVPGYTAYGVDGNKLNPGDVITPTNRGENTNIHYVRDTGKVIVHYVDKAGNSIDNSVIIEGNTGDDYQSESKVINGYVLDAVPENAVGSISNDETNVTYVYEPVGALVPSSTDPNFPNIDNIVYPNDPSDPTKVGSVTVPEVPGYTAFDSNGNELAPGTVITPTNASVNTPIIYQRDTGTMTVHYVDENGNELADSDMTTGGTGDTYTSDAKVINGYVLKTVPANNTGEYEAGNIDVNYVYEPVGQVIVSSTDADFPNPGNITYENDPNDPSKVLSITVPEVPGYIAIDHNGNVVLSGTVIAIDNPGEDTPLTYVKADGTIVTHYVDENGNEIANSTTTNGVLGDNYTTTAPVINGYVLVETPANSTGTVTTGQTDVTYTYAPVGALVATSDDPNFPAQTPITYPNDDTDPAKVGTVTVAEIPGYTAIDSEGNVVAPGTVITPADPTKDTTINYVPVAVTGQVVTHYVDADGNELAPSTTITGNQGDNYTTTAPVINGYVLVETPANSTGTVTTGQTDVTYTYAPVGALVATSDDPNFPAQTPITYPNDDTDPAKVGTVTVAEIPGYTAIDSEGNVVA
ncbi:MucBP domain-containing protein, partial [Weissella sagaensis]|uniref:MucBP domain-containing protein n=1 Tax=Weissella sagaensis TaxID=2559928 RepID=UPI00214AA975